MDKTFAFETECDKDVNAIKNDCTELELKYTEQGNVMGISVKNDITNAVVWGTVELTSTDKKYCWVLKESKE